MNDQRPVVHRAPGTFSDRLRGDKRALRVARRAAGSAGCERGDRPDELLVFGSRVEKVLVALTDAGYDVEVVAR
jgi:hypothetical protein